MLIVEETDMQIIPSTQNSYYQEFRASPVPPHVTMPYNTYEYLTFVFNTYFSVLLGNLFNYISYMS